MKTLSLFVCVAVSLSVTAVSAQTPRPGPLERLDNRSLAGECLAHLSLHKSLIDAGRIQVSEDQARSVGNARNAWEAEARAQFASDAAIIEVVGPRIQALGRIAEIDRFISLNWCQGNWSYLDEEHDDW